MNLLNWSAGTVLSKPKAADLWQLSSRPLRSLAGLMVSLKMNLAISLAISLTAGLSMGLSAGLFLLPGTAQAQEPEPPAAQTATGQEGAEPTASAQAETDQAVAEQADTGQADTGQAATEQTAGGPDDAAKETPPTGEEPPLAAPAGKKSPAAPASAAAGKTHACEIDLDADGRDDTVILVHGRSRISLYILVEYDGRIPTYYPFAATPEEGRQIRMRCERGSKVRGTRADTEGGSIYETPGAYVELSYPESSSVVFYHENGAFREVWKTR